MIPDEMDSWGRNKRNEFFEEFYWGELEMGRSITVRFFQLIEDVSVMSQR